MIIKSFKEFFYDYKNYDNGGDTDQLIINDAEKIYNKFKNSYDIENFAKNTNLQQQLKAIDGIFSGHTKYSFNRALNCAAGYAHYIEECEKGLSMLFTSNNKKSR